MSRLLSLLLLLLPNGLLAAGWEEVQRLQPNDRIEVRRTGRESFRGRLVSSTADSVTLESKAGALTISRADVQRLGVRSAPRRLGNAAIGAGIGAGVGFGVALLLLAATGGSDAFFEIMFRGGAIGAAVACPLGFLVPGYRTVYRR